MAEDLSTNQTKIIWHRCNSSAKIINAIADPYAAGAEFDVVGTSDNVPMLFHDKFITKELAGSELGYLIRPIEVSELSFAELRKIRPDIESLSEAFEKINTENFSETFEFHLEIKPNNIPLADAIVRLLAEFPKINRQTIPRSFQQDVIIHIRKSYIRDICLLLGRSYSFVDPVTCFNTKNTKTSLKKLPENIRAIEEICNGIRPKYISVYYTMLTQGFINAVKTAGVEVDVYTLNKLAFLKGLKVDRIITDFPKKLCCQ
ncbi:MAG: hypothetical protein K0R98_1804 [Rickettsiaceae bacterium]|jgi:glycerophosphoryl diester phosphodiesterase|nr:hypothetical protein [Rickettsiaceae bacterium]